MTTLREIAERGVLAEFASSGVTQSLPSEEVQRRAQEAGSVLLRLLGETGLLAPIGDPIAPEAFELAEGAIRRVLGARTRQPRLLAAPRVPALARVLSSRRRCLRSFTACPSARRAR